MHHPVSDKHVVVAAEGDFPGRGCASIGFSDVDGAFSPLSLPGVDRNPSDRPGSCAMVVVPWGHGRIV